MRNSNKRWSLRAAATCFAALTAAIVLSGTARADVVYTYTGPDFTGSDGNANGLASSDSITGYLDLATALGAGNDALIGTDSLLSWSFTDGVNILNPENSTLGFLFLESDDSGTLIDWNITVNSIQSLDDGQLFMVMNGGGGTQDDGFGSDDHTVPAYELSSLYSEGSSWNPGPDGATFTTAAPEPSSMLLFGAGLFTLTFLPRLKRR